MANDYVYNSPYALQENKFGLGVELEGKELQPFYPKLESELWRSQGVNTSTSAQKVGSDLLKSFLKAYGTVLLTAAPVEEAIIGGLAGIGFKVEATFAKEAAVILRTGGQEAKSAAGLDKLNRQLASESQLSSKGESIAGAGSNKPLRKADEMARQYGGNTEDYAKMKSSSYTTKDGTKLETHYEQNIKTGDRYNVKTKINNEGVSPVPGKRYQEKLNSIKQ